MNDYLKHHSACGCKYVVTNDDYCVAVFFCFFFPFPLLQLPTLMAATIKLNNAVNVEAAPFVGRQSELTE